MLMARIAAIASRLSTVRSLTRVYYASALLSLSPMCSGMIIEWRHLMSRSGSWRRDEMKRLLLHMPSERAGYFAALRTSPF